MKQTYPSGVPCTICKKPNSTHVLPNSTYCVDCYKMFIMRSQPKRNSA